MVKIEKDGDTLALSPLQKIRFKLRNQIMYEDILPKYYSFPFSISLDNGTNSFLLNYPQIWNNRIKLSSKLDCLVYLFGDNNPRKSILNINAVPQVSAECNVIVDKNVDDIGDKKLQDVDMGKITLGDSVTKVVKLRVQQQALTTSSANVYISINGIMISTPQGSSFPPTFINFYTGIMNNINSANCGVTATLENSSDYTQIKLVLTSNISGSNGHFTLDNIDEVFSLYGTDGYRWIFFEEDIWMQNHLIDIRNGVNQTISSYNPDTTPVVFPIVENIKFIDDPEYVGLQNAKFVESTFNANKISVLTPMPHLVYVIKKVFKALGYDAIGTFLEDINIKRIILYSNTAADSWNKIFGPIVGTIPGHYQYNKLVNVHNSYVKIADHCPDITIKEFLTEIRKLFNLTYVYNYQNRTVNISIAQSNADYLIQNAKDFTSKIVNKWQLQNATNTNDTVKLFKFEDDGSDDKTKQLGLLDYQQPLVIDKFAKKEIVPKVSSIAEERVSNFIEVAALQLPGYYNNQGTKNKLKLLQYFGVPDTNLSGITVPDWAKIWFSSGNQLGAFALNKDAYQNFSYTSDWSLRWDTDKGFYKQCWEKQTQLLNDGVQLKIAITFTNADLLDIEKNPYHILDGCVAIWKDIDVELGADILPTAECLYQLL